MSATSPFVGTRVFSNLSDTVAAIDTRDSTVIGLCLPLPNIAPADNTKIPLDEPFRIAMDDPVAIAMLGPGLAQDTINQIASEGIIADIAFVRAKVSADLETQIGHIVGSQSQKTGLFALLEAKDELKLEPGCLLAPGYTSQRLGGAKNPVAMAMDTICSLIIDCLGYVDAPATSREAAATYAADFAASLNMVAMYPAARVFLDGQDVVRPLSPHAAAAMVRRDKEVGNPFKAAWNRPLKGVRGPSQRVTYRDGDITSDANFLCQNGLGTVIEGSLLWAPYTTATDPTVRAYRQIKRIRTRRSIEKGILRSLRQYNSEDVGPHLVQLLARSIDEACEERKALKAIIAHEIIYSKGFNPGTFLRDGGMRLKLRFEETPALTDLQIYSEPQPEAFDALSSAIAAALNTMGSANIRATD